MTKKVLIVCHHYSIHTKSLVKNLHSQGIDVSLLCSDVDNSFLSEPELKNISTSSYNSFQQISNTKMQTLFAMFSLLFKYLQLNKFDVVELHFPNLAYSLLHATYKLKSKKIGICIWGDDYQLMPKHYKFVFRFFSKTYDYVISGNHSFIPRIQNDLQIDINKIKHIGFGSEVIDLIKQNNKSKIEIKNELNIDENTFIITCGHNASDRQNHLLILDNLSKVDFLNYNILLILPLTYPKNDSYRQSIQDKLTELQLNNIVLVDFLSNEEIIKYRIITDIFIHMQESDSFSAAMAEYLYCKAIVINGDWLNYDDFLNAGGYFLKTSKEELHKTIQNCINNLSETKMKFEANQDIIWNFKSWEMNIKKWILNY
jgi:Glycosyl transferase 4-like/Glycosyl transferases group 1